MHFCLLPSSSSSLSVLLPSFKCNPNLCWRNRMNLSINFQMKWFLGINKIVRLSKQGQKNGFRKHYKMKTWPGKHHQEVKERLHPCFFFFVSFTILGNERERMLLAISQSMGNYSTIDHLSTGNSAVWCILKYDERTNEFYYLI